MAPTRTCVGCRKALPADRLIRVVRPPGETLRVDRRGPGRGAWLCQGSLECLGDAMRRHGFQRAFGVSLDPTEVEGLRVELAEAWGPKAPDVRG